LGLKEEVLAKGNKKFGARIGGKRRGSKKKKRKPEG